VVRIDQYQCYRRHSKVGSDVSDLTFYVQHTVDRFFLNSKTGLIFYLSQLNLQQPKLDFKKLLQRLFYLFAPLAASKSLLKFGARAGAASKGCYFATLINMNMIVNSLFREFTVQAAQKTLNSYFSALF
jgi:hypothetical protein